MDKVILLTENREVKVVDFEFSANKLDFYYKTIGCDLIDIVAAYGLKKEGYCLVVDDEGLFKGEPKINVYASLLYGVLDHGQMLAGNVLVAKDKITYNGVETVGLTDEDIDYVVKETNKLIDRFYKIIK